MFHDVLKVVGEYISRHIDPNIKEVVSFFATCIAEKNSLSDMDLSCNWKEKGAEEEIIGKNGEDRFLCSREWMPYYFFEN